MSKVRREHNKYWKVPIEKQYKEQIKALRKERRVYISGNERKRTRLLMEAIREDYGRKPYTLEQFMEEHKDV